MVGLGIWLAAIGVADITAGRNATQHRQIGAALLAGGIAAMGLRLSGYPWYLVAAFSLPALCASEFWLLSHAQFEGGPTEKGDEQRRRDAILLLVAFAASCVVIAITANSWPMSNGGALQRWLNGTEFQFSRVSFERAIFVTGTILFLIATSNVIVRLVFAGLGDPIDQGQQSLKGGRLIGPVERLMIFGFTLAGQLTGAAFIVSAKSLLRFPEIRASADDKIDAVTEYFLVGSMVSWLLALLPLVLIK